jgi:hypothetical protein
MPHHLRDSPSPKIRSCHIKGFANPRCTPHRCRSQRLTFLQLLVLVSQYPDKVSLYLINYHQQTFQHTTTIENSGQTSSISSLSSIFDNQATPTKKRRIGKSGGIEDFLKASELVFAMHGSLRKRGAFSMFERLMLSSGKVLSDSTQPRILSSWVGCTAPAANVSSHWSIPERYHTEQRYSRRQFQTTK